jgi:glycosyltransferase involved in cell wall biosynthesis
MNPLISVIIPVYKVEAYLRQCVDSVLNQTYQNLEIILVDDGSPDNCPKICDEYAVNDKRVKVIHKINGGLSDARNAGLNASTGEFILFLDSDDYWIGADSVKELSEFLDKQEKVDIIYFDRVTFYENSYGKKVVPKEYDLDRVNGKSKTEVLTYFISEGIFIVSACHKLIRKSILIDNDIVFEKGLLSEDLDWNFKLTLCAEHFFVINNPFYGYRKRAGSITTSFGIKNANDLLYVIDKWSKSISENVTNPYQKELLLGYCAYLYGILMGYVKTLTNKEERLEIEEKMGSLKYLLQYNVNYKTNKVLKLYKLFGFQMTCWILSFYIYLNSKGYKYNKS